jgi:hypothetical protein
MGDGKKPHMGNSNSRPFDDEEREITLAPTEPRTFDGGVKPLPEAELLSCEAIAAVGSAIRTLAETVWIPSGLQADATTRRSAGSMNSPGVLFYGGQDVFLRERYKINLCVVLATPLEILAIARLGWNKIKPNRLGAVGVLLEGAGPIHDRFSDAEFLLGAKAHGAAEDCFETL